MQPSNLVLLSGQMALSRALDVTANNVANASTTGYKRESIEFDTYLNRAGAGQKPLDFVVDRATHRDFSSGPIETTGNTLDLAITGHGYFEVQLPDGSTRYTRGGSFQLNNQGQIVNQAGDVVLSDGGQGISIPETVSQLNISGDGFVTARVDNGKALAALGKVALVKFDNEQKLQAAGSGLYSTSETPTPTKDGSIVQGALEKSNVEPITEINNMIQIMRNYEQVSNMINMENTRHTTLIEHLSQTTV